MLRPQKSSGLKLNLFSFTIAYGGCVHLGFAWIGDLMPSLGISSHAKTMTWSNPIITENMKAGTAFGPAFAKLLLLLW